MVKACLSGLVVAITKAIGVSMFLEIHSQPLEHQQSSILYSRVSGGTRSSAFTDVPWAVNLKVSKIVGLPPC